MILNDTYIELIVKFNGDIMKVSEELGAFAEIIDCNYAIVTIPVVQVEYLYNYEEVEYFEPSRNISPNSSLKIEMGHSGILPVKDVVYELNGKGVIVGIIDSGIDFTHKDFLNDDGESRILYIWDQSVEGNAPNGFLHGTEYTNAEINKALTEKNPYASLPSRDTAGHGTAVAGIAAGNSGVASLSSIISVKLGRNETAKTADILRGVKYITDKALELSMPASINISYGMNNGSHTGDSLFEQCLGLMSGRWKLSISVAMGNEGGAGHHFSAYVSDGSTTEIPFTYQSFSPIMFIDVWKSFNDNIDFELIAPNGISSGNLSSRDTIKLIRFGSMSVIMNYKPITHFSRIQEIVFTFGNDKNTFIPGIWTLIMKCSYAVDKRVDMWMPTVAEVGLDTAFLNPDNLLTLTLPSTVEQVISVGGYNPALGSLAFFTGKGTENLIKPDIVAPAINVITSSVGGGYDSYSGTSVASPFVCGSAALMMEWGIVNGKKPFLYGEMIKAYLIKGAKRNKPVIYPDVSWGYGSLDLIRTMELLELNL